MKLTFPLALFVGLFFCLNFLSAQNESKRPRVKRKDPDVTAMGQLEEQDNGTYLAKFDLGRLSAGLNAVIDLKVKNPYDRQIKFSGVSKKCKCSNFRPDRYYFSPNDTLNIRIRLKLPIRRNSRKSQTEMLIVNQGISVVEMVFDYELEGLLSFTDLVGIIGFDSDKQTRTLDMPFLATRPVDLDNLILSPSENLQGCEFEIIKQEEGGVVRVRVTDSILNKSIIRGQVMIEEQETNRRDAFFLTIKDDKLAEISPSVLTFKNNDGSLVATATLKMANAVSDDLALEQIKLECSHNGISLASRLKRISDKLVQVVLTANNELAGASKAATLKWKVVHQGSTTNLETPFVISD